MAERKYSVAEIDQMRVSVGWLARERCRYSSVVEIVTAIEVQLRTYMMNGTEPEELEAAAQPIIDRQEAEDAACRKQDEEERKARLAEREQRHAALAMNAPCQGQNR